ncbi:MAG TPA: matrixin family metalloprotease [Polyangiaceae bacterium]
MFRDDGWPYRYAEDVLGLATVTFDVDTGEIYDVDIEINTTDFAFTTGDTTVGFDLGSTLQHETGHFFGISHSAFEDATMFATPHEGSTQGRRLSADDAEAICAVYPPESAISAHDCKPAPHPFSAECSGEVSDTSRDAGADVGCTLASTAKRSMPSGGLALAAFCLLSAFGHVRRNAVRGSTQSASSRPYSFRTRSSFNRRRPPA